MQVTTYTTHNYTRADMGEWLFHAWRDGQIDADDEWVGKYESFAQFGRRTIYKHEGARVEYHLHHSITAACEQMMDYHTNRAPVSDYDVIVWEGTLCNYHVSAEGTTVGKYQTREAAELAAAQWMVDHGVFGDAFYVNGRGDWHRIDDKIREYHDAGGDQMADEWTDVTPEDVD